MHKLPLTLACGRYDRTQALIDGRVQPDGVDLTFLPLRPGETFWRMLNHGEFDASEMSLSSYTILRSEGDTRFIAIPVFPSRIFRHSALYVRSDASIESPEDLKGKRVGVGDYQMTAAVWVRGFLTHDYGVKPEDIVWVTGKPIHSIKPPTGLTLQSIPADTTLEAMLERGEIDALISVMIPRGFGKTVRRLFLGLPADLQLPPGLLRAWLRQAARPARSFDRRKGSRRYEQGLPQRPQFQVRPRVLGRPFPAWPSVEDGQTASHHAILRQAGARPGSAPGGIQSRNPAREELQPAQMCGTIYTKMHRVNQANPPRAARARNPARIQPM